MGIKDCKTGGGFVSRWDYVAEQVAQLVAQACTVDRNGIFLGLFNTRLMPLANASADGVRNAFKRFSPQGGTHIADAIHARIEAYFARKARDPQTKSLVLIVVTDGEPTGTSVDGISKDPQQAVADVIVHATKRITSGEEIGIFFLQVGADKNAPAFLGWLDAGLTAVGAAFDIVSVKTADNAADMTIAQLITSAQID